MLHAEARAPRSTYRLQLHAGFGFADAEAVLPYLRGLGIGDYSTCLPRLKHVRVRGTVTT